MTWEGFAETARAGLQRVYGPLADPKVWRATLYHLLDCAVAWAGAAIVVIGLFASMALAPLALLVLAGALTAVRRVAGLERARARGLLGVEVDDPPQLERGTGFVQWVRAMIKDTVAWRAVGYLVVRFTLGNAAFFATVGVWWAALALITTPIWAGPDAAEMLYRGSGMPADTMDLATIVDVWWEYVVAVVVGLGVLALAPRVVQGFAGLSGWAVRTLLGPAAGARIRQLEGQRSSAVRVADVDRRRIEQDLHDGAQVRLTALAMQLGLAREAITEGADTARVAELVDDAHAQAKLALREIRDLARGIHPAVLTDRGLDVALTSMVGRLPIPVDLEVEVADRPSPEVESIVYFVAAEAVTNAVRHADSPTVGLRVVRDGDEIVVEIRDRGRGGADPSRGTGLTNLRERVEATGGEMTVQSPEGVGTLVRAAVPCGS